MFCAVTLFFHSPYAASGETDWYQTEGGKIRLVTEPFIPGATQIRGVIDIDLIDGWKTYWRDPGSGGIPPSIDMTDTEIVKNVQLEFPAPVWIESSYGDYAGYKEPVKIPFTLELSNPAHETTLQARLMIGICADICIPAFHDFQIAIAQANGSTRSGAVVLNAFAALPKKPEKLGLSVDADTENTSNGIDINVKGDVSDLEFFVSSANGTQFKMPRLVAHNTGLKIYNIKPLYTRSRDKNFDIIVTGRTPRGTFEQTFAGTKLRK